MRLKASSLLYALIITTVLALTSTALITLSSYQKMLFERDTLHLRLTRHAQAGIELLLKADLPQNEQSWTIPFGDVSKDTLYLLLETWGAYQLATARAWHHSAWRKEEVSLTGLVGYTPDSLGQAALYLSDQSNALSLVGASLIRGKAYLPRNGIRAGIVDTKMFLGKQLLNGVQRRSSNWLPSLDTAYIKSLLRNPRATNSGQLANRVPSIANLPFDSTSLIITGKTIRLTNQHLSGKVIIKADDFIHVAKQAKLEDVLLLAPIIQIDSGFQGSLQAFASKRLKLGNNIRLKYPSVLGMLSPSKPIENMDLEIGEMCLIQGGIYGWNGNCPPAQRPKAVIGTGSIIEGQVYMDGWLDLKGSVYGNVVCRNFLLRTPTSIYENHIMDGVIDASKRSTHFVGTALQTAVSNPKKAIVKWGTRQNIP